MDLRIADLLPESTVDGPGLRYVVFFQGCNHFCPGCHNPKTWDPNGGRLVNVFDILNDIEKYKDVTGVTLSGGEPLLQLEECHALIYGIFNRFPHLNIVLYTGYKIEEVIAMGDKVQELITKVDYIVDGCFKQELKRELPYRGSSNQRFIKVLTAKVG